MSSAVTYNSDDGFITIWREGSMDKALVKKLASETGHIARQNDCYLVLCDAREATMGMCLGEIYELPKVFIDILLETGVQIYKFKRALVVSADVDDFTFFETVSRNRGQNVMLFRDMNAARSWLIGK